MVYDARAMAQPIKPLTYSEKRRHPRYQNLVVSVAVEDEGAPSLLLPVLNLSIGGLAAAVSGAALERFTLQSFHALEIFDPSDPAVPRVRVYGETMRRDATGVALMWDDSNPAIARAVGGLLEAVRAKSAL